MRIAIINKNPTAAYAAVHNYRALAAYLMAAQFSQFATEREVDISGQYLSALQTSEDFYRLFTQPEGFEMETIEAGSLTQKKKLVVSIARFFVYFMNLAQENNLPLVVEVIAGYAYDMCQMSLVLKLRKLHKALFATYFEPNSQINKAIDGLDSKPPELPLLGVRRAQIKLATEYIVLGKLQYSKKIFEQLKTEPLYRLVKIWHQLMMEDFPYMLSAPVLSFTAEQKAVLPTLFSWFENEALNSECGITLASILYHVKKNKE